MSPDDEQRPSEPPETQPEYKVYRSRRGPFSRLKGANLSGLRDRARLPSWRRRKRDEPGMPPPQRRRVTPRGVLKWVGLAALAWILISLVAFGVSAQIQSFELSGEAGKALHGNPFLLPSAQTILVLGTDARPPDTDEPGAPHKEECFEQQSHGDAPHDGCEAGEYRADTLMLIQAGGGAFRKLSIPRDVYAEIPGQSPEKINAAYSFGGAKLQIEAVEQFLDLPIDHVVIVDFTGFEDLIDAVGGVKIDLEHKFCTEIAGGAGGG